MPRVLMNSERGKRHLNGTAEEAGAEVGSEGDVTLTAEMDAEGRIGGGGADAHDPFCAGKIHIWV